jgi:polyribonucleotide nucleotidyltransferase
MLDAGVKMKRPVSGIAMGLITDPANNKFAVLSDILGDEDHLGDMDFKVTGTVKGITATQMDIKVGGLSYEILTQALLQAKQGREHILGEILKVISEPREDYKPNVPRVEVIQVPKEFIGPIIGPGGKNIQKLQEETKTVISIEEKDDIGYVQISSTNRESLDAAIRRIKLIVAVPEKGEIYKGKVKSITSFGAFVEIMPGKEGLLHISEISWNRLQTVEEELQEGQEIEVKLLDMDRDGKMKLSRRVLLPKPEGMPDRPERSNDDRPRRDDNRGGGDRRDNRGGDRRDNRGGDRRDNRDRN